jgi:hypothetical protein
MWGPECQSDGVATIGGIKCVFSSILGLLAPLLALVAFGMIVFSGAKMIMAGDNPKEVAAAQQSLTFAIVGLSGIGIAWLILVVIQNITGAQVLTLPSF